MPKSENENAAPAPEPAAPSDLLARFVRFLEPPPPAASVAQEQMRPSFRYWRLRLMSSTFIGYAVYYVVRKNIPVAMKAMGDDLGIAKSSQGLILTLHDVVYGVSKLVNGMVADRTNPRALMALGMFGSAAACFGFGLGNTVAVLATLWAVNAWFQGMGFPPVARILSHWFSPRERGVSWGIFNASHMAGAAAALALAGWLIDRYGSWRLAFLVPSALALVCGFFLLDRLRDTPASLGLPPVEVFAGEAEPGSGYKPEAELSPEAFRRFVRTQVYGNPYIWLISLANFNVYLVRYAFLNWGPTYLQEVRGWSKLASGGLTGTFELAGLCGSLLAGYVTDRWLRGRRAPLCVLYMIGAAVATWLCAYSGYTKLSFWLAGFAVYGPQFLVGVMMADLATRRATSTAIGISGFFGYLSGTVSGWGIGSLSQHHGWSAVFNLVIGSSLLSALLFALCWNAQPKKLEILADAAEKI